MVVRVMQHIFKELPKVARMISQRHQDLLARQLLVPSHPISEKLKGLRACHSCHLRPRSP